MEETRTQIMTLQDVQTYDRWLHLSPWWEAWRAHWAVPGLKFYSEREWLQTFYTTFGRDVLPVATRQTENVCKDSFTFFSMFEMFSTWYDLSRLQTLIIVAGYRRDQPSQTAAAKTYYQSPVLSRRKRAQTRIVNKVVCLKTKIEFPCSEAIGRDFRKLNNIPFYYYYRLLTVGIS